MVIDEAHIVAQWGSEFRPSYGQVGFLRALVPSSTPFLAVSATMDPNVYKSVTKALEYDLSQTYEINLGNYRTNIRQEVRIMTGNICDFKADFDFICHEAKSGKFCHRMIFVDSTIAVQDLCIQLQKRVPKSMRDKIAFYCTRKGLTAKTLLMRMYTHGKIDILFTTEAAGMVSNLCYSFTALQTNFQGCDIKDIGEVIQYGTPSSLDVWVQRAGRAGRQSDVNAHAILFVEPSIFRKKKKSQAKAKKKSHKGDAVPAIAHTVY